MNHLRATCLSLLAFGLIANFQCANSPAFAGDVSTLMKRSEVAVRASGAVELAVNPLSNVEWNAGLTPPPVRRVRFNERYGGCC